MRKMLGHVWLLWAEKRRCCQEWEPNYFGVLVGVFADIPSARDAAAEYLRFNPDAGLQILREDVCG